MYEGNQIIKIEGYHIIPEHEKKNVKFNAALKKWNPSNNLKCIIRT
jgi:hypothetical protein